MDNALDDAECRKRAYREMRILRRIQHRNIVSLVDVAIPSFDLTDSLEVEEEHPVQNDEQAIGTNTVAPPVYSVKVPAYLGSLYLAFNCCETDLGKIFKSDQYLSEEHVQFIMYQLLDGLHYLHANGVVHRDIKPANILVDCSNCTIQIADFGLARVVDLHSASLGEETEGSPSPSTYSSPVRSSTGIPRHPGGGSAGGASGEGEGEGREGVDFNTKLAAAEAGEATSAAAPPAAVYGSLSSENSDVSVPTSMPMPPPPSALKRDLTMHVVTRWCVYLLTMVVSH